MLKKNEQQEKHPISHQKLIHAGKILDDNSKVSDAKLGEIFSCINGQKGKYQKVFLTSY